MDPKVAPDRRPKVDAEAAPIGETAENKQLTELLTPEASPTTTDGWISWPGGECPVKKGTLVDVRFLDGHELKAVPALTELTDSSYEATYAFWRNDGWFGDIIAYRVAQQPAKPSPRVTPADVDAAIASEHYFTGADGVSGAAIDAAGDVVETLHVMMPIVLTGVQFCVLVLKNGHIVTGEALLQDLSKPDPERARASARRRAFDKAYDMVVYAERERLAKGGAA